MALDSPAVSVSPCARPEPSLPRMRPAMRPGRRLRVALYHPWVYLMGGAERVLAQLVRRSRHRFTILTNHFEPDRTFPELSDCDVVELRRVSVERRAVPTAKAIATVLAQRLPTARHDALMVSAESVGELVTLLHARLPPCFAYCHTPMRVAYDDVLRTQSFRPSAGLLERAGVRAFRTVDRVAWRRFARVFCNSRETERRLLQYRLVRPERTEILHPGVDLDELPMGGPSQRYFLLPGRIAATKNLELGIEAFLHLRRQGALPEGFGLVIAGMVDAKSHGYHRRLRAIIDGCPDVEIVVDPDDATMHALYQRAWAVLCCSLNEDWGLTVIEGMAFGKPVVAVGQGGPAESVLHGRTGLLVPPRVDDYAAALRRVAADEVLQRRLGRAARTRAGDYDWDRFVARLDDYVDALVPGHRGRNARGCSW
jgi:glycosyltransferase involved in cell wall biosynthesis